MPRRRPSTTSQHDGPDAARLPVTEVPLPGVDPAWSRTVTVASTAPVEPVPGRRRRWHLLDNAASLEAAGLSPRGTVLAVHGNPTWSYLWRDVLAAGVDPANPWRVVAVDQLDMGFSERTGLFRRLDDRVRDLADLTAALGLDAGPVVTLAHDWGGLISSGWALEHPDAHRATILTNTAVHHDDAERIPAALRLALAPAAHGVLTRGTTAFLDAALALADPPLPRDVRAAYRAPYGTRERREAIRNFVADIPAAPEHPSHARYERIAAGLAAREVPALLLWGSGDPVFQERYLQDLVRRMPHADVHRYEGAQHLLPEARDVAGPVLAWLADRFGPGPTRRELHLQRRATARDEHVPFHTELEDRRADPGLAVVDMAPAPRDPGARDRVPPVRASLTWAELADRVDRLAAGLSRIGVRAGDRVNLMVPPGSDLTALLYACLRIGAVVVVADTGLGPRGLTRALKGAAPDWLVGVRRALVAGRALGWPGTRISLEALDPVSRRALGVAHDVPELLGAAPRTDLPVPDPDADAVVLFTSGSTGPAKGVVYTHRQLGGMRDAVRGAYGLAAGTGLVAGFAPFALLGPAMGATSVTPDMDVTAPKTLTARALADAAAAIRATAVFLSPAAIANVLATRGDLDDDGRGALARVELMLSAGAPLPEPLLEDLQQLMPAATLHTPYGMTEGLPLTDVTLGTIRQARRDGTAAEGAPMAGAGNGVCVGTAVPGAELGVTALRPDGTAGDEISTEAGLTGEIVARAPHLKDRYDRLWYTEHLSTELPGWHRTGDVGHVDAAGRLWVEGRLAHVIVAAGGVLTPVAAEHAAQTVSGVGRAAVVGVGPAGRQVPVAVVETVPPAPRPGPADPGLSGAVREAVRRATGLDLAAVLVLPEHPTDIRHNSKIDRALLAGWAADALAGGRIRNP